MAIIISQPIVIMPIAHIANLKYTGIKTFKKKGHYHITKTYQQSVNKFWKKNVTESHKWKKIDLNLPEGYIYDSVNGKIMKRLKMYKLNNQLRKKYSNNMIYQGVLVTKEQKKSSIAFQKIYVKKAIVKAQIQKLKKRLVSWYKTNKFKFIIPTKYKLEHSLSGKPILPLSTILRLLASTGDYDSVVIKYGDGKYYSLNTFTSMRLQALFSGEEEEVLIETESDKALINTLTPLTHLELQRPMSKFLYAKKKAEKKKKEAQKKHKHSKLPKSTKKLYGKPNGAFFRYSHKLKGLDLTALQIYSEAEFNAAEEKPIVNLNENCFLFSLRQLGLAPSIIQELAFKIAEDTPVMRVNLTALAAIAKINITLSEIGRTTSHPKIPLEGLTEYHIGLIDHHYFAVMNIPITYYAITHYHEIKDLEDWYKIRDIDKNNKPVRSEFEKRQKDSFTVVKLLIAHQDELLHPITRNDHALFTTAHYDDKGYESMDLHYSDACVKPCDNGETDIDDAYDEYKNEDDEDIDWNNLDEEDTKFIKHRLAKERGAWNDRNTSFNDNTINIFFDFETHTEKETGKHIPDTLVVVGDEERIHAMPLTVFRGLTCGKDFLVALCKWSKTLPIIELPQWEDKEKTIPKLYKKGKKKGNIIMREYIRKFRLIAHNAQYDFHFIIPHLKQAQHLSKGNKLISAKGRFYNFKDKIDIEVKCSYAMTEMKLAKFGKSFHLKQEKEVMPYSIYTQTRMTPFNTGDTRYRFMNIEQAIKEENENMLENSCFRNPNNIKQFRKNIEKWGLRYGADFDIYAYRVKYCEIDVMVLMKGYNQFKKDMNKITGINIDKQFTLASLADKFMKIKGVYDGCYQLTGVPQQFIQKCVVGGRCMTNRNLKWKVDAKLADYDARSLYPSAMLRLAIKSGGYLIGKPKVIPKDMTYDILKYKDGYFVEIEVMNVPRHRQFPLQSVMTEEGVRDFTNKLEGERLHLGKVALEDFIKYHNVTTSDFKIIRGYYFDEGRNPLIGDVISYLYDNRVKYKDIDNPLQLSFKLLMNSAYGKTMLKPIKTKTIIKDNDEECWKYVTKYSDFITKITRYDGCNKWRIDSVKPINNHFNIVQIGVEVLDMSKRIMNEVMCLAEDMGLLMFYIDTDSIHMLYDDVVILEEKFKKEYHRELVGKAMGQFHIDYEIEGCKDVYSEGGIWCGKKVYLAKLVGDYKKVDELPEDWEDDRKEKLAGTIGRDLHIRNKGITNKCIKWTAKTQKPYKDDPNGIVSIYNNLLKGKEEEFDMLEDNTATMFESSKDGTIRTRGVRNKSIADEKDRFRRIQSFKPKGNINEYQNDEWWERIKGTDGVKVNVIKQEHMDEYDIPFSRDEYIQVTA